MQKKYQNVQNILIKLETLRFPLYIFTLLIWQYINHKHFRRSSKKFVCIVFFEQGSDIYKILIAFSFVSQTCWLCPFNSNISFLCFLDYIFYFLDKEIYFVINQIAIFCCMNHYNFGTHKKEANAQRCIEYYITHTMIIINNDQKTKNP